MNPDDEKDVQRLTEAARRSRDVLQRARKQRVKMIKEWTGPHYGGGRDNESGLCEENPVPLLTLAGGIYSSHLAANRPQVLLTTASSNLMAFAKEFEQVTNNELEKIDAGEIFQQWFMDAFLSIGILCIGQEFAGDVEIVPGQPQPATRPFMDNISLDDWVHDTSVMKMSKTKFMGHRYRLPLEFIKESGLFENTDSVSAITRPTTNADGDERARALSGDERTSADEYELEGELWDYWIRAEQIIVTIADGGNKVMRKVKWVGRKDGPYHFLDFDLVPDNAMPLPPAAMLIDLHQLENRIYRKLSQQSNRQKDFTAYEGGEQDSAERVQNVGDGGVIHVNNIKAINTVKQGGVDQANLAFGIHIGQVFSKQAGGLDTLGGLAPQAATVGQESLLNTSASKRIAWMADRVQKATTKACTAFGWRHWNDPLRQHSGHKTLRSMPISVPFVIPPGQRQGTWEDYRLTIVPYSMSAQSPAERIQKILSIVQQVLLPMTPLLDKQGITLNLQELCEMIADYLHLPEMRQVYMFASPDQSASDGVPQPGAQSPVTQRTNIRENRSTATPRGQEDVLMQRLMSGAAGPSGAMTGAA